MPKVTEELDEITEELALQQEDIEVGIDELMVDIESLEIQVEELTTTTTKQIASINVLIKENEQKAKAVTLKQEEKQKLQSEKIQLKADQTALETINKTLQTAQSSISNKADMADVIQLLSGIDQDFAKIDDSKDSDATTLSAVEIMKRIKKAVSNIQTVVTGRGGGGAEIKDTVTSLTSTRSSTKISTIVTTVYNIINNLATLVVNLTTRVTALENATPTIERTDVYDEIGFSGDIIYTEQPITRVYFIAIDGMLYLGGYTHTENTISLDTPQPPVTIKVLYSYY